MANDALTPEERARETADAIVLANDKKWGTFCGMAPDLPPAQDLAEAIASALLAEREAATRAEREAVVGWLRQRTVPAAPNFPEVADYAALAPPTPSNTPTTPHRRRRGRG